MVKSLFFRCIKGKADKEDLNVIIAQGDIVEYAGSEEGSVYVVGVAGFCEGLKICFTPSQFAEMFESYGLTVTLK